jgi:ankyrin repeat protein
MDAIVSTLVSAGANVEVDVQVARHSGPASGSFGFGGPTQSVPATTMASRTPLQAACQGGHVGVVVQLIGAGANVNRVHGVSSHKITSNVRTHMIL